MKSVLLALAVLAFAVPPAVADAPLDPAAPLAGVPGDVRAPDVNGDGRPDIVAVLFGTDEISVRLNNGHGFGALRRYDAGFKASIQETADFNRDGRLDMAVSDTAGSQVAVFLGSATGFADRRDIPLASTGEGRGAFGLVARDVNHDGREDIVAATSGPDHLEVILGNGDGTFQPPRGLVVPSRLSVFPFALAAGDFDRDGNVDLVSGGVGSVTTYLGAGDGTFRPAHTFDLPGLVVAWINVDDANSDRRDDVVLSGTGTQNVDVLEGDGRGGFAQGADFLSGGVGPQGLSTGDLNGDHRMDITVANTASQAGQGNVAVFLGTGAGRFVEKTSYVAGVSPFTTAMADFDGDGKLDLLSAVAAPSEVHVSLGNGNGTFRTPTSYPM